MAKRELIRNSIYLKLLCKFLIFQILAFFYFGGRYIISYLSFSIVLRAPGGHHIGVIHGDAHDLVNTFRLHFIRILDVSGQMGLRATWCESSGNREQNHFFPRRQFANIHFIRWRIFEQIRRRQIITNLKVTS